jgi:hypothetical protein
MSTDHDRQRTDAHDGHSDDVVDDGDGDGLFIAASSRIIDDSDMRSVNSDSEDIEMRAIDSNHHHNHNHHHHRHHHRHRHRHQQQQKTIVNPAAEESPNTNTSTTTIPPRGRPDYRQFTFWQLRASLAEVLAEHPQVVNERDLGYTDYWNNEADEMLPACVYLALGFFCFVPWLVGCFFIRSRSPTARIAGILSAVLAFMLFAVLCVVLFNQFI